MTEVRETTERDETAREAVAAGQVDQRDATAGATFRATRDELLGDHPLLDSAEIARSYCAIADRVVSVVAITPGRIRRVDGWLGGVGFVTHAAANDPSQRLLGSVCDRARSVELTGSIVGSLVGGLPEAAAGDVVDVGRVGAIRPDAIPTGCDWIVIISASRAHGTSPPDRCIATAADGGLAVGALHSLDDSVRVHPGTTADLDRWVTDLLGLPPRSVAELLAEG
jgi:hypothetical protein